MSLIFPFWNRCIFSIDFGLSVTVVVTKAPIFVRSFSDRERETLEAGLRSKNTFTLRRSQKLLASSRGDEVPPNSHEPRMRPANGA